MKTVLIAEDDFDDAYLFERAAKLAAVHVRLQFVVNGEEVTKYLMGQGRFADRERFPVPDLVILDYKMPLRNGLETLQWIRTQAPSSMQKLPVIFLSSSREDQDVDAAYEFGANGYLVKPVDNATLQKMITCVCEFWCHYNRFATAPVFAANCEGFAHVLAYP